MSNRNILVAVALHAKVSVVVVVGKVLIIR